MNNVVQVGGMRQRKQRMGGKTYVVWKKWPGSAETAIVGSGGAVAEERNDTTGEKILGWDAMEMYEMLKL